MSDIHDLYHTFSEDAYEGTKIIFINIIAFSVDFILWQLFSVA